MQKNLYYLIALLLSFGLLTAGCGSTPGPAVNASAVSDSTAPLVLSNNPGNNNTGVPINTSITVTFNEAMDTATIDSSTFLLSGGVTGPVSYDSETKTATFTPSVPLAYDSTYTVTITAGVKDLAGNAMASSYPWSFTTGSVPDTTAPTVQTHNPGEDDTGVPVNSAITVTFGEPMKMTTITTASFLLSGDVDGTVTYDEGSRTATFRPSSNLSYNTTYTVIINTGVKDSSGNAMASPYSWTFTTAPADETTTPATDTTAPEVQVPTIPVDGATGVEINTAITVTFNEAMDAETIDSTTFKLNGGVEGTVIYDTPSRTATFHPIPNLAHDTTYTATITTGVRDLSGNALAASYSWTFTTGSEADTTAPTIQTVYPVNGAVDVQINPVITAVFNEDMEGASFDSTTILLTDSDNVVKDIKDVIYDPVSKTVSFKPQSNLSFGTTYTVTMTGVMDGSGNEIASPYSWSFTTVSGQTLVPMDDAAKEKIKETIKSKSFLDITKFKDSLFNLPAGAGITGDIEDNVNIVVTGDISLDGTMISAKVQGTTAGIVKVDSTNKPVNISAVTKVNAQKDLDDKWTITGSSITDVTTTNNSAPEFLHENVKILLKNGESNKIWEATTPDEVFNISKLPYLDSNTKISIEVIVSSTIGVKVYLYHEGKMDFMKENGSTADGDKIYYKEYTVGDKIGLYTGFVEVISKESFNDSQKFQSKTWVVGYTIQ